MKTTFHRVVLVCVLVAGLGASVRHVRAEAERRYPHSWQWTDNESRRIRSLANTIPKVADGYWTVEKAGVRVRSSDSAVLTAEATTYVELLMRALPNVLCLPPLSTRVRFEFSFHRSADQFATASGGADTADGFGRIRSADGEKFVTEIHLLVNEAPSNGSDDPLGARIDLGVLQYRVAQSYLRLYAPERPLPVFLREGCASYFETIDVRGNGARTRTRAMRLPRPSYRRALQSALLEGTAFRASLDQALHQSDAEFDDDRELQSALADSVVDFLQSSARSRATLRALLSRATPRKTDPAATPSRLLSAEQAAAMEAGWYRHLCRMVAHSLPVQVADLSVSGNPPKAASTTSRSPYGNKPLVSVMAAGEGAFDVAWFDGSARTIRILQCDPENRKVGELTPAYITDARALLGAARLPDDGSYVVGYSRDNDHGDKAFELRITRFDRQGKRLFDTRIFGDKKSDQLNSKGGPGGAGTARIAYNERTGRIGFYCSHNMKCGDGVRHQGGYIGFLGKDGKRVTQGGKPVGNGWFFSHNFDQRLIVAEGDYYALAHGDAYPRALGFSRWSDRAGGNGLVSNAKYHVIPGRQGDNKTDCQTGGLVSLAGGSFAVLFASSNDRPSHDLCIKILSSAGRIHREKWLTSYPPGAYGAYPRIARYGSDVLVAWEEVGGSRARSRLQLMLLNEALEAVRPASVVDNAHLSPYCDLVTLDDGAVVWAVPAGGGAIRVCRIDRPEVLEARLLKTVVARPVRTAGVTRAPKSGAVSAIDRRMIAKLAGLYAEGREVRAPIKLSISATPLRLKHADESGAVRFVAGNGSEKTATVAFGELPLRDRAVLTLALLKLEPDNRSLYGVVGFYFDCAGDAASARRCYGRAGEDVAGKFADLFSGE